MALPDLALSRHAVDRAAERRGDAQWLRRAWEAPGTRVLVVSEGRVHVDHASGGPRLRLLAPHQAPDGERYLLGVDDAGVAHFAVAADALPDGAEAADVAGLREVGGDLGAADVGLLVHAVALEHWHRLHPRCPRCGGETEVAAAGHERRCVVDGSAHYPRTDPAVIMAVETADRLLLGRQRQWPEGRFSCLAGFVEPGESLEQAVRREAREESGVRVGEVSYRGSQPWPFPASLMLGFRAEALDEELRPDGEELAEVRWVTRDELAAETASGALLLPPEVSIARRLIEEWFGGPGDQRGTWAVPRREVAR